MFKGKNKFYHAGAEGVAPRLDFWRYFVKMNVKTSFCDIVHETTTDSQYVSTGIGI